MWNNVEIFFWDILKVELDFQISFDSNQSGFDSDSTPWCQSKDFTNLIYFVEDKSIIIHKEV